LAWRDAWEVGVSELAPDTVPESFFRPISLTPYGEIFTDSNIFDETSCFLLQSPRASGGASSARPACAGLTRPVKYIPHFPYDPQFSGVVKRDNLAVTTG
jgi:hypothetical protein